MVLDKYFEEFQYGNQDGYFANKNVSVSANLIFCWPNASYDFQLNLTDASRLDVEYIKL